MIGKLLIQYGPLRTTIALTALCVLVSLLICALIWQMAGLPNLYYALLVAFVCPLLIAPPVIMSLSRLTEELRKSQNQKDQINSALQISEERHQFICDRATDLIQILSTEDGRILYVNKAWRSKLGFSEEDTVALRFPELVLPSHHDRCVNTFRQVLSNGKAENIELLVRNANSHSLLLHGNANCVYEDGVPRFIQCIFRDVTAQRKLEEDLLRLQKNSSLAMMAGGLAHDFNNYLTVIKGRIDLALAATTKGANPESHLSTARTVLKKAEELTRQLQTFARDQRLSKKPAAIDRIVMETASFAMKPADISYDFRFPQDLWRVDIDSGQFNQVFHNLIINAIQAMQNGGTITIGGENVDLPPDKKLPLGEGRFVRIFIADQGCGISESALKSIFDPYYTSKENGQGLGLAVVYSVINNHNGYIDVESPPGHGTTFHIYIPATIDPH